MPIAAAMPGDNARTAGGQLGLVAAGASISRITATGRTEAFIDNGAKIDQDGGATVGDITVRADHYTREKAFAIGVAAGILAGVGQEASLSLSPVVSARVGDNVQARMAGILTVRANATPELDAEARGYAAGLAAVGVSLPKTTFNPSVTASIGNTGSIDAGGVTVEATTSVPSGGTSARSLAVAALGGLIGVTASTSETTASGSVSATRDVFGPEPVANTMYCLPLTMYVTGSPVVPAGSSISHNTLPDALSYARNILPPPMGKSSGMGTAFMVPSGCRLTQTTVSRPCATSTASGKKNLVSLACGMRSV